MKKIFIFIILINSAFLFSYDLRGYWGKNILTPEKINYKIENSSWGSCKVYDTDDGFFIDRDINDNYYIKFTRWGKILIEEITENTDSSVIKFHWKNKASYIEFTVLSNCEIYISKMESLFIFPNGKKNRLFKLEGPLNQLSYPVYGKIKKTQDLTWCGSYIGKMTEDLKVAIMMITNASSIDDDIKRKELIIRVDEKDLIDFNEDYFKKYELERKDSYVYGEILLDNIELDEGVIIY